MKLTTWIEDKLTARAVPRPVPFTDRNVFISYQGQEATLSLSELIEIVGQGECEFRLQRVTSTFYELTIYGPNEMMHLDLTLVGAAQ